MFEGAGAVMGRFHRLPTHVRELLIRDPMALQRKHDAYVADFRLITGADVWVPKSARKALK